MTKHSKRKLLFITLLLTLLLVYSAYLSLVPLVHAAEPTVQDKTIDILNDVVDINTEEYATFPSSQLDNQYLSLPQKEADIYLVSEQGGVRASCSFVNNMLRQIYLSDYEGDLSVEQPAIATVYMAKGFLQRYQNYAEDSFYGELASTLDNVDVSTNITKSAGHIKLEVLNWDQTIVDYVWTYTDENGIVAKSKNVILSYDRGQLKVFLNNWPLYTVVGTPTISSEEATAIAVEASKNFLYEVYMGNGTEMVSGFKIAPKSLGHATLSYLNFPNQSLAREGDPFTLYPSWYVPLGFDKSYPGDVTGMTVTIWADTGEVSSTGPMIVDSPAASSVAEETITQEFTLESTTLPASIVIVAIFGVLAVSLFSTKKCARLIGIKRLFYSRFWGILLCGLFLFGIISLAVPKVSASSTIPNSKSRIYAAMHEQEVQEKNAATWVCQQIADAFIASGYSTSNLCESGTTRQNEMNNAQYDEDHYDRTAVFHFGHLHQWNTAYRDNYNESITDNDISSKISEDKHCFILIWVCAQAQDHTKEMPKAWTSRSDMSSDGYLNPDCKGQCYIGFNGISPQIGNTTRTFEEQMTLPVKWFIKYFYDYALKIVPGSNYAVRDSLNKASLDFFGTTYTSSILRTGYEAWYQEIPGHPEFPSGWYNGSMKVFGDGSIWLFQPKITFTTNCGQSPTFYLDGEPHYVGDVHVWPTKFYTISVSDVPNYSFDHFSYDGNNWGRPCSTQLPHSGEFTAHYNWDPTYYTLSISAGEGGTTKSPYTPGDYQLLSYTYAHVEADPNDYWILDKWLLDGNDVGSNPSINVLMDEPHTLEAVFAPNPPYKYVLSIYDYGGPVNNPHNLVGWQNDGQFAGLYGYGPYQYYGWIIGNMNAQATGHIYMYGYCTSGYAGHLYVYVSSDANNWNLVSTPYVSQTSPYWIDCGTYQGTFNYIAVTVEHPYEFTYIGIDSVRVEP